jgi:hypothetical protein
MSISRRYHSAFLGAAIVASTVTCLLAALSGAIAAAVIAAVPAVLVLTMIVAERRGDSVTHDAVVEKMVEQTEASRKGVIYDRDTGLFAHWYIALRGEEECNRAARYERPLTLLAVEPGPEADDWAVYGKIALWLRQHLRTVDIAAYLGNARFVVIMPETSVAAAENVVARFRSDFSDAQTALSSFPADGGTFEQLHAVARERLGKAVEQVA